MFGERGRCDLSPLCYLLLSLLSVQPATDGDRPEPQEVLKKLAKKPVCSLVVNVSLGLRLPPSGPSGSGCLSPEGDGLQLANSVPSFILYMGLVVSYVRDFCVVAIPPSGLLAQVSPLRLPLGHSGLVLTLSNAAHASLPSSRLLVVDAGICAAYSLGVTTGHIICGFKLFIYFSSQLCCPLRFQGSPQTRQ